jgi:excisionase family DNA binding protein
MHTLHLQLAITVDDEAARTLAELLVPTLRQAALSQKDADERREARLRAPQQAIFVGQKPPDDQGLLIDSKHAAKLLRISERTLWEMHHTGGMPPPIRIGRAVRWSLEALKRWVEEGCPAAQR